MRILDLILSKYEANNRKTTTIYSFIVTDQRDTHKNRFLSPALQLKSFCILSMSDFVAEVKWECRLLSKLQREAAHAGDHMLFIFTIKWLVKCFSPFSNIFSSLPSEGPHHSGHCQCGNSLVWSLWEGCSPEIQVSACWNIGWLGDAWFESNFYF